MRRGLIVGLFYVTLDAMRVRPLMLLIVALPVCRSAVAGGPPNIVLIVADDLGYGELGCYGQQIIKTPHIDGLAREGMRFTQFYAGQAVCAPSRCALLTGKHMGHAAIRDNANPLGRPRPNEATDEFPGQIPLPDTETTLAELLHARGYATGVIGKWGLGYADSEGDPHRQGFDRFYGYLCQVHAHNHYPRFLWDDGQREYLVAPGEAENRRTHSQDRFTEEALEFIRAHRDEPFFLYVAAAIPHLSIQVPEAALEPYLDVVPEEEYEHRGYRQHPTPRAGYAAMVSHLDAGVGRIAELLDELELTESTLILFTSDNGPAYDRLGGSDSDFFRSSGPLRGRKGSLWEGGIRVPLVVKWPGRVATGATSDHVAAFWDMLPTLCEAAGANVPPAIDGISFVPAFMSNEQPGHEYLYWEFPAYGGQQAVRTGNWKAIRRNLRRNPDAEFRLYDLEHDIGETHNVAGDHPDIVAQIERIAREARVPSRQFPFPALD